MKLQKKLNKTSGEKNWKQNLRTDLGYSGKKIGSKNLRSNLGDKDFQNF
jgi:hypothetical protein